MTRPTRPRLDDHPSVRAVRARSAAVPASPPDPLFARPGVLDRAALRELCRAAGADDAGVVEIERPALADQVADITAAFPRPRALIAFVRRTGVEAIRSPVRSVGNLEFHRTGDEITAVGDHVVRALRDHGVRALHPAAGFPMEMGAWPGKTWVIAHKPVAVEAGLGHMGIHRNVIHPRFGNFVLLGSVTIRDGACAVAEGHAGRPDLRVTADTATWLAFLGGRTGLLAALLRRRIRLRGAPRLLVAFGRCFPR